MDEKRTSLLKAAAGLFSVFGYKKTTVSDITDKAGVAKGTFYIYFTSKAQIFLEVWKGFLDDEGKKLRQETLYYKDSVSRVRHFLEGALQIRKDPNSLLYRIGSRKKDFFSAMEEVEKENLHGKPGDNVLFQEINRIITEGISRGEFRKMDSARLSSALFCTGILSLFMKEAEQATGMSGDEILSTLNELLLYSICEKKC